MKTTARVQHRMAKYIRVAAAHLPPSRGHVEDALRKGPASKTEGLYRAELLLSSYIFSCNPKGLHEARSATN